MRMTDGVDCWLLPPGDGLNSRLHARCAAPALAGHGSGPCSTTLLRRGARLLAGMALACGVAACGSSGSDGQQGGGAKAGPGQAQGASVPTVGVVVLEPQDQVLAVRLPGRAAASQSAEVRPQVSGIVRKRLFTEGGLVRQGQPLYQIDPAMFQAAHASAEAALAKARSNLDKHIITARRNAELVRIEAISQQAFDEGEAAVAQARADVAVAQAALEVAALNLRYSHIAAPIAGRIGLSAVSPGALVTANQTTALTEIVQTDPMHIDFTQSTTDLLQLRRDYAAGRLRQLEGGDVAVRIVLEDGSTYPHEGRLRFTGLLANATMGTVTLRAVVPNPDGLLLPGMYVQALLPTGLAQGALLLPQQAVSRDLTGRASVLVVAEDDTLEKRTVQLGQASGAFWLVQAEAESARQPGTPPVKQPAAAGGGAAGAGQGADAEAASTPGDTTGARAAGQAGVRSGVRAGDRVVVDGLQKVRPGTKVRTTVVDLHADGGTRQSVDVQAEAAALRAAQGARQ